MKKVIFVLTILLSLAVTPVYAALLRIDITKGNIDPIPIAVPDFGSDFDADLAANITKVIEADLQRSGLFSPIEHSAFIEEIRDISAVPHFSDWRQINAQALLVSSVKNAGGDKIKAEFRLWDVFAGTQFAGKSFTASRDNWRRVAHLIADEIYSRLTGEGGYFDSRIVYILESGSKKRPIKRLAIMDQDGANNRYLTSGKEIALTPRFDPSSQRIIYMTFKNKKPKVYLYNLETGKEELLGQFSGISFAPRFSPDGKKAIMSVAADGDTNIYTIDLSSRKQRQLTNDPAIDTSPSYSPDGKQIVFNSDRGGSQQIYVMNNDGGNVKRISFGRGNYGTPVWSPRGDMIAFTRIFEGKFYIGVMRPDGSGERLLTESYLDEGPTWSPNGRVIIFARQEPGGKSRLYSIDLTGYNLREVNTSGDASDPAWSPLLSK